MAEQKAPVPGEGNMVYPPSGAAPVQGVVTPEGGLQEPSNKEE